VDLFNLTRVALPGPLPRDVPLAITYRLRGLPESFRTPDDRQRFAPGPAGETLLTVIARRPAAADPARDAPRASGIPRGDEGLLGPGSSSVGEIDSDAPAIRALAAEAVGETRGVYGAAVRLSHLVHERLRRTFGSSRDRASEMLATGEGDCTEHALLFTALARAAGIPSRPVYGLVYTRYGSGGDGLYWHAWVEVRSGEEWIALDPTFDQPVADATHVTLGRASQVDAMGLLGSLQVISAEPQPAP
jgi:transglutaminase-like putative cysteine protease